METQKSKSARTASTTPQPDNLPRRTFCRLSLVSSTSFIFAAPAVKALTRSVYRVQVAYPPMKICNSEAVLPGSYMLFNYPGPRDPAILLRSKDGEFFAYSRKCAHLGCSVDFDRARQGLTCPCHLGAYDGRTGFVVYGPPQRPLDAVVLQMRAGGEVWAVGKLLGSCDWKV